MGGRSSSSSASSSAVNTQNLNLQEIDGVAVAGVDGDVSIQTTDQGSVSAARDVAIASLDTGLSGFQETVDAFRDVVDVGGEQTRDVLEFARNAQSGAFELVEFSNRDSLDFARDISQGFREELGDVNEQFIRSGQSLLEDVIDVISSSGTRVLDAVGVIQARESGNTDARLEGITRIALIGAAGVVAIVLFQAARK